MGLFSKSKRQPGLDVGALQRIAEQNKQNQQRIIGGLRTNLAPISSNFETKRGELSARILPEQEEQLNRFGQDLSGLGKQEAETNRAAGTAFREQSFRNVPELQRSIRESLGGSGLFRSGAAASALAAPTIDAARASRDFETGLEVNRLGNISRRNEGLATTGFNTRSQAVKDRLGLDDDTLQYLTSIGREDLIREAQDLTGVEDTFGQNLFGIEQARQADEAAQAKASAARRGQILTSLGSLAGTGIGFVAGGPLGASLGSQLGSTAGNLAGGGGGGGTFDPTLLFALAQRNKANTIQSLGSRGTYNPNISYGQLPR